ncbi:MAG: energy transducer TonB [bacterium]
MGHNRQTNTAIRIAVLASLLIHGVFLGVCGRMISPAVHRDCIKVDLVMLPAISTPQDIPRPKAPPLKDHAAPASKTKPLIAQTSLPRPRQIRESGHAPSVIRTAQPMRHAPPRPYANTTVQDIIHGARDVHIPRIPTVLSSRSSFNEKIEAYLALIYQRIEEIRTYPPAAKRQGIEGSVRLGFLLFRDGRLGDIRVTESSSYAMLDQAAIENVKAGDPYPPFPSDIREESIRIEVPIVFRLMETSTRN